VTQREGTALASEDVIEVVVRRHVFSSGRPFPSVLEGIFGGISQPDIGLLFSELAASTPGDRSPGVRAPP